MGKYKDLVRFINKNKEHQASSESGENAIIEYQYVDYDSMIAFIDEQSKCLDFGDYIEVEQKRFFGENEFYTYKVINTLKSNSWIDVPAVLHLGDVLHDSMEPIVLCVVQGISEETVYRFRVSDVKLLKN